MPIKNMTPEQIEEANRAIVTAGGKSTDKANRLPGETATEANARITAAYKELVAKPILSKEQKDAGMTVQAVRTQAGGFIEYVPIKPPGYTGPTKVTDFTDGIVPAGAKYTTGSRVGLDSGNRTVDEYTKVLVGKLTAGNKLTAAESAWLKANGSGTLNPNVTTVAPKTPDTSGTKNAGLTVKNGILYSNGKPYNGTYNGKTYTNGQVDGSDNETGTDTTPKAPVGTPPAYTYNETTGQWEMPAKPTTAGNWKFDANNGWVDTTVNPGSSGMSDGSEKTLALDTFKNTLALLFGAKEASQPWVTALYDSASKFYNSGSTTSEAINLSLQDVRYNKALKPFTDRFKGIYALTDRLAGGEAIEVPTIAEYFKSEAAMGDVLRTAGMGELATQDFLGGIIGLGKSVLEVTNLITDTFDRIDNAPSALKADLQAAFPGADRTSIAKAMLLGPAGAAELTKKVKAISVQSAAKTQGVSISDLTSQDIAAQGYDYNKSLTNFATVKQTAERGATLGRMSGIALTQEESIASAFGSNAAADEKIRKIKEEELNRFSGTSGRLASQNRSRDF
jgi:hypothetical protein